MKLKSILVILSLLLIVPVYAEEPQSDFGDRTEHAIAAPSLVGSWVLDVRLAVSPPFRALQTFHGNGTMNETSDLLPMLGEGPGHGAWTRDGDHYAVTFELFIFEADHTPAGLIRVRESITLKDADHFTAFTVADLILPDGTLIENIDGGPAEATRVRVMPVRPEEYNGPSNAGYARSW